ncbi:MAG: site-2 protease family protein [Ruminococcaceae bacterium]|nr:site-2 protease family protein [Oscillospiraceae bacterium]
MIVIKILVALLFFGFMILSHEFGHYITARIFKVGINEFAIGMGPKLLSKTSKKTGIVYSLRAIPIGGFVSLVGEDEENDREDSLNKKAWWKRFIILGAGSFMNILTAVVAMFILLSLSPYYPSTTLAEVESSVLAEYGAAEYDKIVEIDGEKMSVFQDVSYKIASDGAEPLDITVERDGKEIVLEDVQFKTEEVEGILCGVIDFKVYAKEKTFGTLVKEAFMQSFSTIKIIYSSIADLFTGKYGLEAVSGPVGTVNVIAESVSLGFESILYLFVFISMNLGIFNLLPIPALDGGRLIFVIIEAIRGKPIKPEHEGIVHAVGMIILLAFMAVVVVSDIIKLI